MGFTAPEKSHFAPRAVYNDLSESDPTLRPVGIVFVTNAVVSARIRDDVVAYCREHGYVSDFWAHTELDMRVKKYPEIIREFFYEHHPLPVTSLHQLPPPPDDFTGREDELDELRDKIERGGVNISGLRGLGGIGKTVLALKLAEQLAPRYPDAQLFLDLKGSSPQPLSTAEAMSHVIRSYHPAAKLPESEAELSGLYRSVLHNQRTLLVMDNAADGRQVEPLIPPAGCALLVTSRRHFDLPGLFALNLETMPPDDARKLLLTIAPRIGDRADALAKLCGYLPLALRLAASALNVQRDLSPADYEGRLTNAKKRLELIDASLSLSYELLDSEMQKRWRALAVFPDTFEKNGAAAIWELDLDDAQDALSALAAYSLVEWNQTTARYRLHDLARIFADSRLNETERATIEQLHSAHYLNVLGAANNLYMQGGDALKGGLELFDLEWGNIEAGHAWAERHAGEDESAARHCSNYPNAGVYVLDLRQHARDRIRWLEAALTAARKLKNRASEGIHLGNLGLAYADLGEVRRAIELYEQQLEITREIGDRRGEGNALWNMSLALDELGERDQAIANAEAALKIYDQIEDPNADKVRKQLAEWRGEK